MGPSAPHFDALQFFDPLKITKFRYMYYMYRVTATVGIAGKGNMYTTYKSIPGKKDGCISKIKDQTIIFCHYKKNNQYLSDNKSYFINSVINQTSHFYIPINTDTMAFSLISLFMSFISSL